MLRKFFLITVLFVATLCLSPLKLDASTNKIVKFTAKYQPLGEVLDTIQLQSGIRLIYVNSRVDSFRVFRRFDDTPYEAVRKALIGTPFDFIQKSENLWVIVPKRQTRDLPARVDGHIIDANLKVPIAGVNIYLHSPNLGTTTDNYGNFQLAEIPPGRQKLFVSRIGYHEKEIELLLSGNRRKKIEIQLESKPITTQEIIIEEKNLPVEKNTPLTKQKISSVAMSATPTGNDGDVFELLHQQPGISRRDIHDVFPHIEGGSATEVIIELDGMPIYVPTFGENRRSVFAAPTIQNITLHRSGFGVEYGDAMSGVVALTSKDIAHSPYKTYTSASLTGLSINYNKNTPRAGITGIWRTGHFNNDFNFYQWQGLDFFNKFEYRPKQNHTVTLLALISSGSFLQSNSIKTEQLVSQNIGAKYQIDTNNNSNISLMAYRTSLNDLQREFGMRFKWNKQVSKSLSTRFGIDYYDLKSSGTVNLDSLELYKVARGTEIDSLDVINGNFYLGLQSNPIDLFTQEASVLTSYAGLNYKKDRWQFESGLRLPTHTVTKRVQFEPRAKLSIFPSNSLSFSASAGRYYQYSDRSYASEAKSGDNPGSGEFIIKTSSRHPSFADHLRFEAAYRFPENVVASFAYFDKDYRFNDRAYLARINRWFWSLDLESGKSSGYEFWLAKQRGLFQGWLSYTINDEIYRTEENKNFRPYFNRDRIFNATLIYQVTGSLQAKGQYFSSSGYPFRDWGPEKITISPYHTAEEFAEAFLAGDLQTGAIKQYAFGLSFLFSKFGKINQLELLGTQTYENNISGLQNNFKLWASFSIAN